MNDGYIQKQVQHYINAGDNLPLVNDALYRIASYLDFIGTNVTDAEQMTDSQRFELLDWLTQHGYLVLEG